ncbi:hypothetical protein FA13DRAFT_162819 [Coprinellus micaceus]|uniref:Nephrocystin 3-like N-terminal domain-containing protein n=1 Tax=Coprinellus micaceus TaxID=71717 RepID=A0A4Y7THG0_COPMI|nr:hypothetical protein FA13DRAFT_162819 [Coprinellus micaceus]
MHNSAARCDAPKCHPETRKAVQENIFSWMSGAPKSGASKSNEDILWLTGPAGTGKTAIMGTVSDNLEEAGHLAASFYFSSFKGTAETMSKRRFVTTLAYQLAVHPALKDRLSTPILSAIRENPVIFDMSLKRQLEVLVLQPLRSAQRHPHSASSPPLSIVVDGVDECGEPGDGEAGRSRQDDQVEVLSILLQAMNDSAFPFRFIVASRPETWIRAFFTNSAASKFTEIFLDEKYSPNDDIRLFLRSKLAELCRRCGIDPSTWPSEEATEKLVEDASGQFIYVATVLRFIDTPGTSPQEQLDIILKIKPQNMSNPFSVLDALYTSILRLRPNPETTVFWLKAARCLQRFPTHTGGIASAWTIHRVLESHVGQAQTHHDWLPSLILFPEGATMLADSQYYGSRLGVPSPPSVLPNIGWDTSYGYYHRSFLDYLEDTSRCGMAFPAVDNANVTRWIHGRLVQILKCGGPEVPVHPSLVVVFRRCFLDILDSSVGLRGKDFRVDDDILSDCNPDIWLEVANHVRLSFDLERQLYNFVHKNCRSYLPCNPGCKRWRRAISKLPNDRWKPDERWGSFFLLLDRFNIKRLDFRPVVSLDSDIERRDWR